jgi:uncharacterized damage-inducible protein DinB
MLCQDLKIIFLREVKTIDRELALYPDDASVWQNIKGLPNSAGNLILHLCGNLQHFIGANLGHNGYVRNREAEFSSRDLPRTQLLRELDKTQEALEHTFSNLSETDLDKTYPQAINGIQLSTALMLLHLSNHLAYHLGQIDYHRRVVTGENVSANAVAISELSS